MFKILDENCKPIKGSKYSACVDVKSREEIVIAPGETVLVPVGVKINLESFKEVNNLTDVTFEAFKKSHYIQLMVRSSFGKKGIMLANGVGIIDIDYPNEIMMLLHNTTNEPFKIEKYERVGQMTLLKHYVEMFGIETQSQRNGGFGSTGKK